MSYGFDMGFAQANSLQEAMTIALEYTQSQMTEKNIRKAIRDNRYYIPSVRTGYIADEESKNRRADVLADTCDLRCRDAREEQYNAIVQKYDEKTVQQFAVLTAITMAALLENPEQDFLGTVYHNLGLSKSQSRIKQKPSRAVFHAVQCWTDDGTHKHAGFSCSGQVPYPAGKRPVLWCRMPASGGVQCDARAVGIH